MTADMDARLAIDTAVLLLYFVVIISIGLYVGRKEENLKDFALGGRAIPWWAHLGRPARDRYRSFAPVFRRHHFHRPLCGPEGRKPQRLRARRARNSLVGPSWTPGSRSIPQFCSCISSSSFPSAFMWAGRKKTSKTSRSAGAQFRGGPF